MAYIIFSYKSYVYIKGFDDIFLKEFSTICSGNLIRRDVVLTSAQCMPTNVKFDYLGVTYSIKVAPNIFFKSLESMISVHLGLHDRSTISLSPLLSYSYYADRGLKFDVDRMIRVIFLTFFIFFYFFLDLRRTKKSLEIK